MSLSLTSLLFLLAPIHVQAQGPMGEVPVPAGVRQEYFVLERDDTDSAQGPVALVVLRNTPHARGPIREREVRFREGPIHVREVENTQAGRPRAIWRERGATWGRTWMGIWHQDQSVLATTQWGPALKVHGLQELVERPWMPLELLDACRDSWLDGQSFDCLDPLAGRMVQLEVSMRELSEPASAEFSSALGERSVASLARMHDGARLVEWHRCDGSLAGRFLLQDGSLLGFQWQAGTHWARSVSEDAYAVVRSSWFPDLPDRTLLLEDALETLRLRSL
ncbi:MAG: hypothetical protein ACI8QZ_002350 [Chlamydiales bacterium]|jgi:hypothetical protein